MHHDAGTWTSVSAPYVTPGASGDPWMLEAAQHGRKGTQRLREVVTIPPPPAVAEALHLRPDDQVVVRRRVMLLDGTPVELTDSYYPAAIARDTPLAEHRKIPGGAVTLLASLGYRTRPAQEDVSASPATDDEQAVLDVDSNTWLLRVFRVSVADSGQPVEVSSMAMLAEGRRIRYRLAPQQKEMLEEDRRPADPPADRG